MLRRFLVLAVFFMAGTAWAQRALTTPDFLTFSARDGEGYPAFNKFLSLSDGGTLVVGRFEVWYEGVRFRDALRLKSGGLPDTSWRLGATTAGVSDAVETPRGFFLRVTLDDLNGPSAILFATPDSGRLWGLPLRNSDDSGFNALSNYESAADAVYVYGGQGLLRISATTGQTTLIARSSGGAVAQLVADSTGGLWVAELVLVKNTSVPGFSLVTVTRRFSIDSLLSNGLPAVSSSDVASARFALYGAAGDYIYAGSSRYRRAGGAIDTGWSTQLAPRSFSSQYVYFTVTQNEAPAGGVRRAPTIGNGTFDDWILPQATGDFEGNFVLPWPTPGDSGNAAMLIRKGTYSNVSNNFGQPTLFVKEDLTGNADPTVVEYYATTLKRYFMTGRKAEQDALDALPNAFVRTGMRFAAKSSRYRDILEQSVCRMYAEPKSGGSNTHFYGIGDDCPLLNKLTGLKYEGFDFSILKASSAGCSATAPNIVSRLFNNKVATNEGNHRYVVSEVTKAKMMAQGWIDEGPVFCSASVVDAALVN